MEGMFSALIIGWLLFGPAILIALSPRIHGATKAIWTTGAILLILLSILGAMVIAQVYPESPIHIHSNYFSGTFFISVVEDRGVYFAFRWRHVPGN